MGAKPFFKSLSWLLVLNLLVKPAWIFLIDRRVQNIVGHEAYGTYFSLYSLTYILIFVADAGLSSMIPQRLATKSGLSVWPLFRLKLLLVVLYALACVLAAALAGIRRWDLLGYLILIQVLTSLFLFLRSFLTAKQFFQTDAVFSVLDKTLLLLFCIGPVYGFFRPMTLVFFLQLQTLSSSLAVLGLLCFWLRKNLFAGHSAGERKSLAVLTAPFVVIVLLMSAHNRLDAFLLERLHPAGAGEAGLYAAAYRLLDAGNMLGYLTASFLVPFLVRHQTDKLLQQQVLLLCRHLLLFLSTAAAAFVFLFAPWLQQILYHSEEAYGNHLLRLCVLTLPAYYLIHIYGSALTATANFRLLIRIVFFATAVNAALNVLLIPTYGAAGCCVAALVSQYGCGLLLWLLASRRLSLSPAGQSMLLSAGLAPCFLLLFLLGQRLTGNVWIILSSIAPLATILLLILRGPIKKLFLPLYN